MTRYNIIYADPPWSYRNLHTGGSMKSGANDQYPTMTLDNLCRLPVPQIAEKDAVLFLWATTPMLPEALQLMSAWGFEYKTKLVWYKVGRLGMGFWFRVQTEDLLVGIRGKVKAFLCQRKNFICEPPGIHSEKPSEFRELIEFATKNIPDPKRLELFARENTTGWHCLGYDIDQKDIRVSLQELIDQDKLPQQIKMPLSDQKERKLQRG